jgi:arylsulfatase A-like enzyme
VPELRSAICLVIDRLSAAYVGALGNTWIHTPAFDRLAAESLVFDRALVDAPSVAQVYQSYWTGDPAWRGDCGEPAGQPTLAQFCHDHSLPLVLISDDEEIASHPLSAAFDEIVRLAAPAELEQATDWQETWLARFFAAAAEYLIDREPPALVWLHTAALGRIWDSPQTLRDQYSAEDDPSAAGLVDPPAEKFSGDIDPDVLLGLRHAYAGEITVLDYCLGGLLDAIAASAWSDALVIATSCRGFPLGEHGIVGRAAESLYGELLHVPWLVRVPGAARYGERCQGLVQPADLYATVRDWLSPTDRSAKGPPIPWYTGRSLLCSGEDAPPNRKLVVARSSAGETALSTPAWFLRAEAPSAAGAEGAGRKLELYVKPDDRFEGNEVSDRCLDIVEEFRTVMQTLESALEQGAAPHLTLPDALD